ncbi:hypothetical protein [Pseudomonas sp. efr-133-TYG-5]|uniref:hypothetical protein n=1 Tax=Pseudomonas sp. efr-133-TYG-5 TaxID=3040310 RepID=UPI00255374E6|nr:hypothetical protein [Pseudomonas sp. efr-133-TYG-5]
MSETTLHCNGRLAITVEPREMRMSHWLHAPQVVDRQNQQTLLDLRDSLWDLLGTTEETPGGIDLVLRQYPGDRPAVTLRIDLEAGTLNLAGRPVAAAQLRVELDAAWR